MLMTARLEIVLKKAAGLLPDDLGRRLLELLSPTSMAIMSSSRPIGSSPR